MRHCPICGKELVRRENEALNKFMSRDTCGGVSSCVYIYAVQNRKVNEGEIHVLTPHEKWRLEYDRADAIHRGASISEGRVLSGTEIGRLIVTGQITPLSEIRHCVGENVFI